MLCTAKWKAHGGIVLSSIVTPAVAAAGAEEDERGREGRGVSPGEEEEERGWYLVTGANDNDIKIWSIEHPSHPAFHPSYTSSSDLHDPLVQALSTFVSFPSVSNSPTHREDCRQAAMWLRRYLGGLGGEAKMVGPPVPFLPILYSLARL